MNELILIFLFNFVAYIFLKNSFAIKLALSNYLIFKSSN